MKHPDAREIIELTKKLEEQNDITLEEADRVFSLFSENSRNTKLNINSSKFDAGLIGALEEWYKVVAEKIREGKRGNFIFTVYLSLNRKFHSEFLYPARRALREYGKPEDAYDVIIADEKTHASFSSLFFSSKNLPTYTLFFPGPYYNYCETTSLRAGMFCYPIKTKKGYLTISQFMKKLSPCPVPTPSRSMSREFMEVFFNVAAGSKITQGSLGPNEKEIPGLVVGSFMSYKKIPCIAVASSYSQKAAIFVEKDKAPIVKEAWNISIEELMENALKNNIINKKTMQNILSGKPDENFPIVEFVKMGIEYLEHMVQMKIKWKAEREMVEDEEGWLEEIR
jgi:hypothetical protein